MKKFAFLTHPRNSAREDMKKISPLFFCFPETILQKLIPFLNPVLGGKVTSSNIKGSMGRIIWIPLLAKQILSLPKEFVIQKIIKAIEIAKKSEIEVIGLGAFISSITHGGEDLVDKVKGVSITNGNSLTAGVIFKAVEKISEIKKLDLLKEKLAVIGAGGSIGRGASLLLAKKRVPLILIDKKKKINEMKKIFSPYHNITISDETSLIKNARIVIVTTSSTESTIKADYLGENTIVYDITQPRNTSPDILKKRRDIVIIDGGIIDTPTIDYGMDTGLKKHQIYACVAETMICALENTKENHVGYVNPNTAEKMLNLMEKYQNCFQLNIFESFGKTLNNKLQPLEKTL